jgi:hypothetical protein
MTYQAISDLSLDPDFSGRLSAALTVEGRARIGDPLGVLIMQSPPHGVMVFMPFVSSAPGFGDKYAAGGQGSITDPDILAAVQASWADVTAVQGLAP